MWARETRGGRDGGDRSEPLRDDPRRGLGLGARYFDEAAGVEVAYRVRRLWGGMGIALVAGGLSGLLGIGGGVFKCPRSTWSATSR